MSHPAELKLKLSFMSIRLLQHMGMDLSSSFPRVLCSTYLSMAALHHLPAREGTYYVVGGAHRHGQVVRREFMSSSESGMCPSLAWFVIGLRWARRYGPLSVPCMNTHLKSRRATVATRCRCRHFFGTNGHCVQHFEFEIHPSTCSPS